jgi:hypothetical protein
MSDAGSMLDAAIAAFDLYVAGETADGRRFLTRDNRTPIDTTMVFPEGDASNEMTVLQAESEFGEILWYMEPPVAAMTAAVEPGPVDEPMDDTAVEAPVDEAAEVTEPVQAEPLNEAQQQEMAQVVEEAEKRVAQLEGMVASMMIDDMADEVFQPDGSESVVEEARTAALTSIAYEFGDATGFIARLAAIGEESELTPDFEARLSNLVERLDKLEATVAELMNSDEYEDDMEDLELPESESTTIDESDDDEPEDGKAKTAAFFTNARGVRVWHDPSTGKFAPTGFVSPRVLAKLWRGDSKAGMEVDSMIRRLRGDEPGIDVDMAVARVLGPKPDDATDRLHWMAGERRVRQMWPATKPSSGRSIDALRVPGADRARRFMRDMERSMELARPTVPNQDYVVDRPPLTPEEIDVAVWGNPEEYGKFRRRDIDEILDRGRTIDMMQIPTADDSVIRPMDAEMARQALGQMRAIDIAAISGGRYELDSEGRLVFPAGNGYRVRLSVLPDDTYRVERVFSRSGVDSVKGRVDGVYADQLSDVMYEASLYRMGPFGDDSGRSMNMVQFEDIESLLGANQGMNSPDADAIVEAATADWTGRDENGEYSLLRSLPVVPVDGAILNERYRSDLPNIVPNTTAALTELSDAMRWSLGGYKDSPFYDPRNNASAGQAEGWAESVGPIIERIIRALARTEVQTGRLNEFEADMDALRQYLAGAPAYASADRPVQVELLKRLMTFFSTNGLGGVGGENRPGWYLEELAREGLL